MMMRQLLLGIFIGFILGVAAAYYEVASRFGGMEALKAALEEKTNTPAPVAEATQAAVEQAPKPVPETIAPQTADK